MRKIREIAKVVLTTGSLFLLSTSLTLAQTDIEIKPKAASGFEGLVNLKVGGIVTGGITLALVIAAVVFFFILVVGGIRWILSGGDKAQTEGARGQITAALIGLVIVFSAWAILQIVSQLFDLEILQKGFALPSFK